MKPKNFDDLPDTAGASAKTFAELLEVHENSVWRRAKEDPSFPKPVRLGARCTRWRVGDIRAFLKGGAA